MSNATPGDSTPPPAPLPPNIEPPTPDVGNVTSHACPVDPSAVAIAARSFLDQLEHSGLLFPRCAGEECPDDGPDRELWVALSDLENALNPDRRPHDDREQVGRILAWAAGIHARESHAQTDAEVVSAACDKRLSYPLTGLAIGVDTILRWWGVEEIAGRETGSFAVDGWPRPFSRMMAEQMRVAVTALESRSRVRWIADRTPPDPVTAATVDHARRSADATLWAVREILDRLRRPEVVPGEDVLLFDAYQRMRDEAAKIPARGWEPVYQLTQVEEFGIIESCWHQAVRQLADEVSLQFGNAAHEAVRVRWGYPSPCSLVPLVWPTQARRLLGESLASRGEFRERYWRTQLKSEAGRFRFSTSSLPTPPTPPQPTGNSTGLSIVATSNAAAQPLKPPAKQLATPVAAAGEKELSPAEQAFVDTLHDIGYPVSGFVLANKLYKKGKKNKKDKEAAVRQTVLKLKRKGVVDHKRGVGYWLTAWGPTRRKSK